MDPINPVAGNPKALNQESDSPNIPDTSPKIPADNHWVSILAMAIFILFSLGVVTFLYYQNQQLKSMLASYREVQTTPTPVSTPPVFETPTASPSGKPKGTATPKACTQEAKLCPNGSYVGRTGPNCEFAPCP